MKILVVTFYLSDRTGSELFTVDLCHELARRKIEVMVFSPVLGPVSNLIRKDGISVTDNIIDLADIEFDVIHAQHNVPAILARSVFPCTPMVMMVHGRVPALEQPPSVDLGISKFIAVSEGIRAHLRDNYGIREEAVELVRNFVDFEVFSCRKPIEPWPRNLLILSNHGSETVRRVVDSSCIEMGIEVHYAGLPDNPVENTAQWINNADIVVTMGRGVLEAAACERNIIAYDYNGGDGIVTPDNFALLRRNSFNGLTHGIQYEKSHFKKELAKYDPQLGKALLNVVMEEHNAFDNVDKLISIYRYAIQNNAANKSVIKKGHLLNEIQILNSHVKDYKTQIYNCTSQMEYCKNEIQINKDQIEHYTSEIENHKSQLEHYKNEVEDYKNQLESTILKPKGILGSLRQRFRL